MKLKVVQSSRPAADVPGVLLGFPAKKKRQRRLPPPPPRDLVGAVLAAQGMRQEMRDVAALRRQIARQQAPRLAGKLIALALAGGVAFVLAAHAMAL
jgi:hypothetical protein